MVDLHAIPATAAARMKNPKDRDEKQIFSRPAVDFGTIGFQTYV